MGFLHSKTEDLGNLIAEAQCPERKDDRAIREIVSRFDPLARKLGRIWADGKFYREDVEFAARFGLTQAIARHRGAVESFPAYARIYMSGEAKREAARWAAPDRWSMVELSELSALDLANPNPVEEAAGQAEWGFGSTSAAVANLKPEQQQLLLRRYRDLADLAEIATESGCSVPAVSQRLATIHRRLSSALVA